MKKRLIRRIVCAALMLLFCFFVLTSLGHMLCCHEGPDLCPVCAVLLNTREAWMLCLLCLLFTAGRRILFSSLRRGAIRFPKSEALVLSLTPVRLNVKMNN